MILNKFLDFFYRFSTIKTLSLFLVLYLLFNAVILPSSESKINFLSNKKIGVIDLTMGYNPSQTLSMINDYGLEARDYYIQTEIFTDTIYILVYTFLFSIILMMLFKKTTHFRIFFLPFITMTFDFLENFFIVTLLKTAPTDSINYAICCEIVKLCKWITFGIILMFILYGLTTKLLKKS